MQQYRLLLIASLSALLFFGGASWATDTTSTQHQNISATVGQPTSGADQSTPASPGLTVSPDFVLGPTDELRIIVYGEDALNGTQPEYIVSADGKVSLPLIGDVQAGGLTVAQFQASVENAYRNGFLKDPKLSVEVIKARPFFILGEVKNPGQYSYTGGLTVMDAIATAGGFTYRAVTERVFIKHANQSIEREYDLTSKAQVLVQPGDTIRIDERWF